MKRSQSAADYAAIAVAPLLIFIMISALANFLVLILYHGDYPQRLSWILLMFTMGSVAIARIAIEQQRSYSLGYAAALGAATLLVMSQFVGSVVVCAVILLVIGYLADITVRDCTIIDDSIDASGEGLIDAGRLFLRRQMNARQSSSIDRTTSRRAKVHQPGRTVMYLAIAALPLFGIGQFLLPADDQTGSRALVLLGCYLFAALALLATTSLLGLRRYLRQRGAEMPGDVTVSWLGGGVALIVAVLLLACIVPLPGQSLANVELSDWLGTGDQRRGSRFGWGTEAAEMTTPDAATTTADHRAQDKQVHSQTQRSGGEAGAVGDGQRQDAPPGTQSGGKQSAGQSSGDEAAGQKPGPADSPSDTSSERPVDPGRSKSNQAKSAEQQAESESPSQPESASDSGAQPSASPQTSSENASSENASSENTSSEDTHSGHANPGQDQSATEPPSGRSPNLSDPSAANSSRPFDASGLFSAFATGLGTLLKALIALALAAVVGWFCWANWDRLAAWLQGLLNQDPPDAADPVGASSTVPVAPARPFASFRNPIGSESDQRRVVVITFQAFEAWAREHGAARRKDETPSEFARRAADSLPGVGAIGDDVVDAYNRIVYGRGRATQRDVDAAGALWQVMR